MKQKQILFSTPMVQAILEGRKMQTRRIVKHRITLESDRLPKGRLENFAVYDKKGAQYWLDGADCPATLADGFCPYGKPGDVLYVRETWQYINDGEDSGYVYRASQNGRDREANSEDWKWKPSLFMPKVAARIFLRITNIRVERLQDITEEDAQAEGVQRPVLAEGPIFDHPALGKLPTHPLTGYYKDAFKELWGNINGTESWTMNPWIWVVSFERIEKPE